METFRKSLKSSCAFIQLKKIFNWACKNTSILLTSIIFVISFDGVSCRFGEYFAKKHHYCDNSHNTTPDYFVLWWQAYLILQILHKYSNKKVALKCIKELKNLKMWQSLPLQKRCGKTCQCLFVNYIQTVNDNKCDAKKSFELFYCNALFRLKFEGNYMNTRIRQTYIYSWHKIQHIVCGNSEKGNTESVWYCQHS